MTLDELRLQVAQKAGRLDGYEPVYRWSETAKINAKLNGYVRDFAELGMFLFAEVVPLTLTATEGTYRLRSDAFESPMIRVRDVYIEDLPLYDFGPQFPKPGPITIQQLQRVWPHWKATANARPCHWYRTKPEGIVLWPIPDDDYSAFVSGWRHHVALTDDAGAVITDEGVPRELEFEPGTIPYLVDYCAGRFVRESGEAQTAMGWLQIATAFAQQHGEEAIKITESLAVRGQFNATRQVRF